MKIKFFLILIFFVGMLVSLYNTFRFIKGQNIEFENPPIQNYSIKSVDCSSYIRESSFINIFYNNSDYKVTVSKGVCSDILNNKVVPKFYYIKEEDKIFYKGQYLPFAYVYLSYAFSVILPLLGFVFYRKELNNKISTM